MDNKFGQRIVSALAYFQHFLFTGHLSIDRLDYRKIPRLQRGA